MAQVGEWCGPSRSRCDGAGGLRVLRLRLPVTPAARDCQLAPSSATTWRTTNRAVSRTLAGMTPRSASRVATRCTSGSTAASISGSSSMRCTPWRSRASFCNTRTTELGKVAAMSPQPAAILGADPIRPRAPRRRDFPDSDPCQIGPRQRAADAIGRAATENQRRQRRWRRHRTRIHR